MKEEMKIIITEIEGQITHWTSRFTSFSEHIHLSYQIDIVLVEFSRRNIILLNRDHYSFSHAPVLFISWLFKYYANYLRNIQIHISKYRIE